MYKKIMFSLLISSPLCAIQDEQPDFKKISKRAEGEFLVPMTPSQRMYEEREEQRNASCCFSLRNATILLGVAVTDLSGVFADALKVPASKLPQKTD